MNYGAIDVIGGRGNAAADGNGLNVASGSLHNYGVITAKGGTSLGNANTSNGLVVMNTGLFNYGSLTAVGGAGTGSLDGLGVYLVQQDGLRNYGLLTLASGGTTYAVESTTAMMLGGGSTLALGGGKMSMHGEALAIEPEAKLISLTALGIGVGDTTDHLNFIEKIGLGSSGTFTTSNGPVLRYAQNYAVGDQNYSVTVTRLADASSFASDGASEFLAGLETAMRGKSEESLTGNLQPYAQLLAYAENLHSAGAIAAFADRAAQESTPQGTANTLLGIGAANRMVLDLHAGKLANTTGIEDHASAKNVLSGSRGMAYANYAPDYRNAIHVWAQPLYYHGRLDGDSGYSTLTENLGGGSIGFAVRRDRLAFGLSGHYLHSDINGGSAYDADYNGYGLALGGAYRFDSGGHWFAPLASLSGAWTRYRLDQTRTDSVTNSAMPGAGIVAYKSKPDIDVFAAAFRLSNPFGFGSWTLTPEIGVDVTHSRLRDYTENGHGGVLRLPKHVSADNHTSVRSVIGATYRYRAGDRLTLSLSGRYCHEFADKRATLTSRDATGIPLAFRTTSQDVGREFGVIGAGTKFVLTERASLDVDYGLHLGKNYVGHQVSVNFGMTF